MKFSISPLLLLLSASVVVVHGIDDEFDHDAWCAEHGPNSNTCGDLYVHGCSWTGNGQSAMCVHTHEHVSCDQRDAQSCEDDDDCIFTNLKGTKTCEETNRGTGEQWAPCQTTLFYDKSWNTTFWQEVMDQGCAAGFQCQATDLDGATFTTGVEVAGTCQPVECIGKKVPGNCNGNQMDTHKEQCEAETERVTICHRTCSEKNPWVRITIDEDAWSGEGCGHQQHNVTDECSKYGPHWTAWGGKLGDYLLKFHGTRAKVAEDNNFKNKVSEKAYWRYWEPACPYVRHGDCCDWDKGECCGSHPDDITEPPEVETIPPVAACEIDMGFDDETLCPGSDIINVMSIQTSDSHIHPTDLEPSSIFYQVQHGTAHGAATISFKIDNPFDDPSKTMLIQYHEVVPESTSGALDPACIEQTTGACEPDAPLITAGCIQGESEVFTMVTVYFSDETYGVNELIAAPFECCPKPEGQDVWGNLISYTYKMVCECPNDSSQRNLLRTPTDADLKLWQATVGTGH